MQIDIHWLENWFDRFNARYFDDNLPKPRFHIGRARTRLGTMSFKRERTWGRTTPYDFAIGISNYYDQPEHGFKSVLLHEMIHLAIAHSGARDTSPHGVLFQKMMQQLNRDGWDIRVSTRAQGLECAKLDKKESKREFLVLAIEMSDGRCFLSSVNPKCAHRLNAELPRVKGIDHFAWYATTDRWFERMPRVRSFRGRRVSNQLFKEKTEAMKPLPL